jgi:hypothetical protein
MHAAVDMLKRLNMQNNQRLTKIRLTKERG